MHSISIIGSAPTMTTREIAAAVDAPHDSVLKTVRRLISEGVVSGNETPYVHPQNRQTYSEFKLNYRDTMVVASGYSVELRAKIIDRWLAIEARPPQAVELSTMQILEMAIKSERGRLIAEEKLEAAKPAIEFVERYADSTGLKGFRQVCKLLGAKENDFRIFLADKRVMYRLGGEWTPFAEHLDTGRFSVKAGTAKHNDHAYNSAQFTPKGVAWVAGLWTAHRLEQEVAA